MKTTWVITMVLTMLMYIGQDVSAQTDRQVSTKSAYVEGLGNGLVMSFNFDTRFGKEATGLGARVGVGGMSIGTFSLITIPVGINYLAGKNGKYFEAGLGATYSSAGFLEYDLEQTPVIGTMTFGYRSQPVDGGFTWRIGLTPVFGPQNGAEGGVFFIPWWAHISAGYAF